MGLSKTLLTILVFLLFLAAFNMFFFSYLRPGTSFSPIFIQPPKNITSYNGSLQFYPNMLFNHKIITYAIEDTCEKSKYNNMIQAFSILENETSGLIKFQPASRESDIFVTCNQSVQELESRQKSSYFIAGEGGAERAISSGEFWVIEKGKILLYYPRTKECLTYHVELHELLHVFGFKHSDNRYSMMYPVSECNQVLSDDIIQEILRLYNLPELADIYITNVSAVKHGIYIDFDIEIKNQGIENARNITLVLSSRNKTIDTFELKDINYGEGKILNVENVRIPITMLNLDEITFSVETESEELDKSNNQVTLTIV
jgi:hypothetical protein